MQLVLFTAISLHVLAAVFWAGTSFVLARTASTGAERLFRPQMGAAMLAVLAGGYLWSQLHEGTVGPTEKVLGAGVLCALIAFVIQAAIAGPAVRKLSRRSNDDFAAQSAIITANRIAAILLAVATVSMAGARYI